MTSGPNRHYIPAFLQRNFAVSRRAPKKKQQIWRFGASQGPEKRLIKETGSGNFFYSDLTDDAITQNETDLARTLQEICRKDPGDSVNPKAAAALVSHLSMRTAHIRHTGRDVLVRAITESEDLFSDSTFILKTAGLDADVPTDQFRKYIVQPLTKNSIFAAANIPPRVLERLLFFIIKENPEFVRQIGSDPGPVNRVLHELLVQSNKVASDSHDKALLKLLGLSPSEHEVFLETLDWEIAEAPKNGAILPDCVAIAIDENGKAGSHMFVDNDFLGAMVLPVLPDKLLVGRSRGYVVPSDFAFNTAAARLSHSFFLSSNNNSEESRLHSILGEQLQTTLSQNIADSMAKWRGESVCEPPQAEQDGSVRLETVAPESFTLSLWDFGEKDKTEAQRIQVAIGEFIRDFIVDIAIYFPIDSLGGITIADDYRALLSNTQQETKGEDEHASPLPEGPKVVDGVGETVWISTENVFKATILLPSAVAKALISNDPGKEGWAAHILTKHLVSIAWVGMAKSIPDAMLVRGENKVDEIDIDNWLYNNVYSAIKGYTTSRAAANFGNREEIARELLQLLVENLNRLHTRAMKARKAYRMCGNLDKLLAEVLPTIRNVLTFAAKLIGHSSFSGKTPFDESGVLQNALEHEGLSDWFNRYQVHLERFHRRMGEWKSLDEFVAFNIHVERLLYAIGMFPWETSEGLRIEVPCKIPFNPPSPLYQFWKAWKQGASQQLLPPQ